MIQINTTIRRLALSAAVGLLSTLPVLATHGSSNLDRARELSQSTSVIVNNVKDRITSVDPDSVSSMVVVKLPTASDTVACEEADDEDMDFNVDSRRYIDGASYDYHSIKPLLDSSMIIPVFSIVFGITVPFGALVLIVFFICRSFERRKRMKYETIAKAAETGHPLPPEFYLTDAPRSKNKLQSGIVWIGWGVACIILSLAKFSGGWAAIGMIPLFIGLSRLAVYFLARRKNDCSTDSESTDFHDAQQD